MVVPNPYKVGSNYKESEHLRQVRFTNLPENCVIKIFTLTGEQVSVINHSNEASGNVWWDLRSMNNQEIAPGLYIYHVEEKCADSGNDLGNPCNEDKPFIGKFAVIR